MSLSAVEIEQITDCLESEVEKVIAQIMQGITRMAEHKHYRLGVLFFWMLEAEINPL